MQQAGLGRVRTFSIGFDIPGYNEASDAAAVATHLGTDHTELMVTSSQALMSFPVCLTSMTNLSLLRRKFRFILFRKWRGSMLLWHSPATAATNCLPATIVISFLRPFLAAY